MVQRIMDDALIYGRLVNISVDASDVDPMDGDNDMTVTGEIEAIADYDEPETDFPGTGYEGGFVVRQASFVGVLTVTDGGGKEVFKSEINFLNLE